MRKTLLATTLAILTTGAAPARACELALALAVDVSGSVDAREYRIQMDGLAAALRDPILSEALVRGDARLKLVQWTGSSRQRTTVPWTRIDSFETLDTLADRIAAQPRIWRSYSTAIGEALAYTIADFDTVADCKRRLIDLSGDGPSNEGIEPTEIQAELRARGITVNAIAIEASEPDLTAYFFENVIVGDGAFVVTVESFDDYPARIRKKLLREVTRRTAALPPSGAGTMTR